ncbi:MAG: GIY-YIG nuclease family protein [Candidatus Moranbacteria bacterium]|nr:GIY-YIG nuclease family protein [Candidatus Moranbacteria bacterium]MDD3964568.1 GIY-YIG nuclease family protein [Candidatus Moranbacteria bacterium]
MYTIYAIYNEDHKKLYIGQTADLENRLQMHNQKVFKGYTSRFDGLWILLYSEEVSTREGGAKKRKTVEEFSRKRIY